MNLHYRSTNYNPQIASGVYSAAAPSIYVQPRQASRVAYGHNAFTVPRRVACVLSKHVFVETIVYNVSVEFNLLARRTRALGSMYSVKRKKKKMEERMGRGGKGGGENA